MATLHVERTYERRNFQPMRMLPIVLGFGLVIIAFILIAQFGAYSHQQELSTSAVILSPAPVPVPTPPAVNEQPNIYATPAVFTQETAKALPEIVPVPTPPTSHSG
jgi:hypothetical protein